MLELNGPSGRKPREQDFRKSGRGTVVEAVDLLNWLYAETGGDNASAEI